MAITRSANFPLVLAISIGLLGFFAFPWYALQNSINWSAFANLWSKAESANAWAQMFMQGRVWLLGPLIALLLSALGLLLKIGKPQAKWLMLCSGIGLVLLVFTGFSIGVNGWTFESLNQIPGALKTNQYGMGWGALLAITSFISILAIGMARYGWFKGDIFIALSVLICASLLLMFIAYPVSKALMAAFLNESGAASWLSFWHRISTNRLWGFNANCLATTSCGVAWNTLILALACATGTTVLGTMLALMAERSHKAMQTPLKILSLLPIITPPFVVGLGLILLFGRNGMVNQALEVIWGIEPTRWLYGMKGVLIAQLFAFTPIAFMMMRGVVQGIAPSLEEASQTLRASPRQTFFTVTLPLLKPGLANAFLVGFIESVADFGNPILVGGQLSVLSTEIYFAIVGAQYDSGQAAALGCLLLLFALGVFIAQRQLLNNQKFTTIGGKGDSGVPLPLPPGVRGLTYSIAIPWLVFTVVVYLFALSGGFVKLWGIDYSFTLEHFKTTFDLQWGVGGLVWAGVAWSSLFTTLKLAALSAPLTAITGLLIAWLLARTQFKGRSALEFIALLAFAIPGTVMGMAYIMAFNVPPLELTGTAIIIVLCFMFRNLPVGVRAGSAAFEQLDRSLDEASLMLRASSFQTFMRVTLPLLKPALISALVYSFVRAMTTISGVIFLATAEYELSTVFIIGRAGNGDYGVALAYCTVLIFILSISALLIQWMVGERQLGRRKVNSTTTVSSRST